MLRSSSRHPQCLDHLCWPLWPTRRRCLGRRSQRAPDVPLASDGCVARVSHRPGPAGRHLEQPVRSRAVCRPSQPPAAVGSHAGTNALRTPDAEGVVLGRRKGDPPIPSLAKPPCQATIVPLELGKSLAQVGDPKWVSITDRAGTPPPHMGTWRRRRPAPSWGINERGQLQPRRHAWSAYPPGQNALRRISAEGALFSGSLPSGRQTGRFRRPTLLRWTSPPPRHHTTPNAPRSRESEGRPT